MNNHPFNSTHLDNDKLFYKLGDVCMKKCFHTKEFMSKKTIHHTFYECLEGCSHKFDEAIVLVKGILEKN